MSYHIKQGCVGCQFCKRECPVGAINYWEAGFQIDPEACISCGRCAEVCHLDLIYDTDKPKPLTEYHEPVTLHCQVLIIGAGGVGTGAAAKSTSLGLDTIMIEAARHFGGGTYLAHGAMFPSSKRVFEKLGIPDNTEQTVNRWRMMSGGKINEDKVRKNVALNGEFLDWLDQINPLYTAPFIPSVPGGAPFTPDMPVRHINRKAEDDSIGPGWTGSWLTESCFEIAQKNGVRYYNRTRAQKFITDDNGAVIGVSATDPGGEVTIFADAFVLATGTYMMNDEIMNRILPGYIREGASVCRLNVPTNVGDGHLMAREIGAKVIMDNARLRGPVHHPFSYPVYRILDDRENIFVLDDGRRVFDPKPMIPGMPSVKQSASHEAEPTELIFHTKTGRCYVIMDENQLELQGNRLMERSGGNFPYLNHWRDTIEEECACESWAARKADTVEELAVKLGMDPAVLTATVSRWNELCEKGADDDFGKEPQFMHPIVNQPFYAFAGQNFDNGASLGGVYVDDQFRIVHEAGSSLPNIFCAGDCATYNPAEDQGPIGLIGGLGGSWASGYQIAKLIHAYLR